MSLTIDDFVNDSVLNQIQEVKSNFDIKNVSKIHSEDKPGESIAFVDIVLEGGGVKGIASIGALYTMEQLGIRFRKIAGTSAGAIIAALLTASGWSSRCEKCENLLEIMSNMDFYSYVDGGSDAKSLVNSFSKKSNNFFVNKLNQISTAINALRNIKEVTSELGINPGNVFKQFMYDILKKLNNGKILDTNELNNKLKVDKEFQTDFQVVVSDVSYHRKVVFPRDLPLYFYEVDDILVSDIIRCSMSIPFFFQPFYLRDFYGLKSNLKERDYIMFVDGGLVSNFPLNIFDTHKSVTPKCPTFGILIDESMDKDSRSLTEGPKEINNVLNYATSLLATAMEYGDKEAIREDLHAESRIIRVSNTVNRGRKISATEFNLSDQDKIELFRNGVDSALSKLSKWNFDEYISRYRRNE